MNASSLQYEITFFGGACMALATRSAEAAKETTTLVLSSSEHVRSGLEIKESMGTALDQIKESLTSVDTRMLHVADSSDQQRVVLTTFPPCFPASYRVQTPAIKMLRNSLVLMGGMAAVLFAFTWASPVSLASQNGKEITKEKTTKEASAPKKEEAKDPFPQRKKYPKLAYISLEEFEVMRDKAIVIDARNNVEFDVIHIEGAINLSSTTMKRKDLMKLRKPDGEQPIVFYCNGPTCSKSYKGGEKARSFGYKNSFVFDAGVMTWGKVHPGTTIFFGKPMNSKDGGGEIISKEKFMAKCMDSAAFIQQAKSGGYTIYDIRDRDERSKDPVKLPGIVKCNMDKFVKFLNKPGVVPKSKIMILDGAGKQVKWMQYYLEDMGHTEFYFLKGGYKQRVKDGFNPNGSK